MEILGTPILLDHDQVKPIGHVEIIDGLPYVRFTTDLRITREMFFEIFGNVGFRITEMVEEDGVLLIRSGQIFEWSLASRG